MEENRKSSILKLGIFEIGIVAVGIIIILIILFLLHVLPFQNQPAKNTAQKISPAPTQFITPISLNETGIGCVFEGSLCTQGELITYETPPPAFYGLGFTKIPKGTPIKAAISGAIGMGSSTDPKTNAKINLFTITNDTTHLEADYNYQGEPFDIKNAVLGNVRKGQIIGVIGDKTISFRQGPTEYSLIFYVIDKSTKSVKKMQFSDLQK